MRRGFLFGFWLLALSFAASVLGASSISDLVGKWEGAMEFGKFKFKMVVKITKSADGKVSATIANPDAGLKEMPIPALLFNHPEVRLEIDQFGTAFNGKLSDDKNEITGAFEEGPGGKPITLAFKRSREPDAPEPKQSFTFAAGEPWDIRGYWKASVEAGPGMSLRIGLKIGRITNSVFRVMMDVFDQGAADVPATSISVTNSAVKLEWQLFQIVFEGKLNDDGKSLAGSWKQGGRTTTASFERLNEPATALPANISFTPDKDKPEDIRGHWKGTLEVGGNRLRLAVKIGKIPDGSYAGSLVSVDQGSRELPMSGASFNAPNVELEWKGIRGKFQGTINKEGTMLEGTWDQMGMKSPLKLERTSPSENAKKP